MKSKMLVLFNLHFVSIKCQFVLVILSHKVQKKNIANFWCFHHKYEAAILLWKFELIIEWERKTHLVKINTYIFRLIFFTISLYITFRSNTFSGFFIG